VPSVRIVRHHGTRVLARLTPTRPLLHHGFGTSVRVNGRTLEIDCRSGARKESYRPQQLPFDSVVVDSMAGSVSFESLRFRAVHDVPVTGLRWHGESYPRSYPGGPPRSVSPQHWPETTPGKWTGLFALRRRGRRPQAYHRSEDKEGCIGARRIARSAPRGATNSYPDRMSSSASARGTTS
jgi:hypothetical protein